MTRLVSKSSFLKTTLFVAVGCAVLAGSAPAFAASPATDAFVANVHPNVDFLDQSSRMAIETSTDARVRAFARGEAIDQTLAGNQLVAWTQTRTAPGVASTVDAPLDGASGATDIVLTGRSVAIDTLAANIQPRTAAPGILLPSGETDMRRLSGMKGHRFTAFYATTQKDALRQLVALYTDYARDGDDPALRAMAERQLLLVRHRLAVLATM